MASQPVSILLVEDNEIDVMAFRRQMERDNIANPLFFAENGQIALDMLRGENGQEPIPRPFLIFLDINMPVMNGLEFLETLRQDAELAASVVFVLTTSDHDQDMLSAYDHHVAGYIVKQTLGDSVRDLSHVVDAYTRLVTLPSD